MASDGGNESLSDTCNIFGSKNDYGHMLKLIVGFHVSQIVHSAAMFSLAEHLAQGPKTAVEIAEAEALDVDATFRLMGACTSLGSMTYKEQSGFAATPLLRILHKDDPKFFKRHRFGSACVCPSASMGSLPRCNQVWKVSSCGNARV